MDPVYDDVVYLIDGLQRLTILDTEGVSALCNSLVHSLPHSPWSTGTALVAFMLLGVHDWAPYILNGALVFFLLLIANFFLRAKRNLTRFCTLSVVLFLPLTFRAVHEFRPDFAVALCTSAFSLLLIRLACLETEDSGDWKQCFPVGLLAGLAYLIKPSFFAHTTAMLCASIILAEVCRCFASPGRIHVARLFRRFVAAMAGVLLVAGPYFILSWRSVLDYFVSNTGSGKDAALWKIPGGFRSAFTLYLLGDPTRVMLGPFATEFLVWLLVGLGFAAIKRNGRAVLFILSGVSLALVSLLIMSVGDVNNTFFAFTGQIIFILTTFYALGELLRSKGSGFVTALFCLLSTFIFYESASTLYVWALDQDVVRGNSINQTIVRQLAQFATNDLGGKPPVAYVAFAGPVNASSQAWLALKGNLDLTFNDLQRSAVIEEHLAQIQHADFVEIADPSSKLLYQWLPSAGLQGPLLERLRHSSEFRELPQVRGKEGTIFLFERNH